MRRDGFGNAAPPTGQVALALHRGSTNRSVWTVPRKEPVRGPRPLPPRPQDLQELRGEHHVAVLLALAEGNAQDHPLTIDRRRGEPDGFRDPQARGVTRRQDRAVLREGDAVEKLDHFRGAETTGKVCGFFGAGITASTRHAFLSVTV